VPPSIDETLALLDYRRRVSDLYGRVRAGGADEATWRAWRDARDELFTGHAQSPYAADARRSLRGLPYFDHDPRWRTAGVLEPAAVPETFAIAHSSEGETVATRIGVLRFAVAGREHTLPAYWLEQYGGGLFAPFRDATSGDSTYGGGRYLLDTAKSADLGTHADGSLVLDFNYAYHPSCAHDPRWSCPLALPDDRLDVAVTAGERLAA
jgi:uncharacterized protein (DUF1684 family)